MTALQRAATPLRIGHRGFEVANASKPHVYVLARTKHRTRGPSEFIHQTFMTRDVTIKRQ
jgi:hypothetical protein